MTDNNVYRSMQGKTIELDKLVMRNETVVAVGNARVNARGDELGPGGKIIKKTVDVAPVRVDAAIERPTRPVAKPVEQSVETTNTVEATPTKQQTKSAVKQVSKAQTVTPTESTEE
jgi:hypothetical protein